MQIQLKNFTSEDKIQTYSITWMFYLCAKKSFENKIHKEIGQIISSFDKTNVYNCICIPTAYLNSHISWKLNPSNPYLQSSLSNLLKKYPYDNVKISYEKYPFCQYIIIKTQLYGITISFD